MAILHDKLDEYIGEAFDEIEKLREENKNMRNSKEKYRQRSKEFKKQLDLYKNIIIEGRIVTIHKCNIHTVRPGKDKNTVIIHLKNE